MLRSKLGVITMKLFILAALGSLAVAGAASARQDHPDGTPSGIVIHLFGPDSVSSHFLPDASADSAAAANAATPVAANAAPGASTGNAGGANHGVPGVTPIATSAAPAQSAGVAGTGFNTSGLLHEMFVTGDPNQTDASRLSKGRAGAVH
jgi:hypothetical protein